ncbi:hypothetical protein D3C71_23280 [compost metagenome]
MVRIDDANCLALLAQMEGPAWVRLQQARPERPYSFLYLLAAWTASQEAQHRAVGAEARDFLEHGEPVIYGEGGYHRYVLRTDGELVFSRSHAREVNVARAQALGFALG